MDKTEITATLATLGLTVAAKFVPFSQSRNKGEDRKTLNWTVTVQRNGRDVLTTDYSAGVAHCPSYAKPVPRDWEKNPKSWQKDATDFECESGLPARFHHWARGFRGDTAKPILPDPVDVLYSLAMDSFVLDAGGFEDWASEFGYDTDSRQAESLYRACLEIALKLRAAIGDSGMGLLRDAFSEY
jgi:hypothetical protein